MENPPATVNSEAETAIANRNQSANDARLTITKLVEKRATTMYDDVRAQEFVSALVSASERNSKIKQCNPQSVIAAMMACIMLDLTPETNQQFAYLIPYGNSIQFQIGYKGLMELAYRSGMVLSINAELVFGESRIPSKDDPGVDVVIPADQFEFSLGTDRKITHNPNMNRDRTKLEDVTHVYATATLINGGTVFDVMSMSEINKIRETVKAKSTDAPWKTWPEQMAKKTVIKRLMKYLPQSRKDNRVHQAAQWDSWAEAGKLGYKDGKLIESKPQSTEPVEQPKRTLQALAKPPENVEPTSIPDSADESLQSIIQKPKEENTSPEVYHMTTEAPPQPESDVSSKTDEEYRTDIKDMLEFLKISKREEMRVINEHAKTPLLEKADHNALFEIYKHFKEVADAKTDHLAEREDSGSEE